MDITREKMITDKLFGVIACMDDDIHIAGIKFGFIASLVVQMEKGDQGLFPDSIRCLIEDNRAVIFKSIQKAAAKCTLGLGSTSHVGCGGAALQEINDQTELDDLTKIQSERYGINYYGRLSDALKPQPLDYNPRVWGYIARSEAVTTHENVAYIDISVGGGITDGEKNNRYQYRGKKAFELSADWIACALDEGMLEEEILALLMTEINIAKAIILKGKNQFRGCEIFDAGRLGNDDNETVRNVQVAKKLLEKLTN